MSKPDWQSKYVSDPLAAPLWEAWQLAGALRTHCDLFELYGTFHGIEISPKLVVAHSDKSD